MAHYESDFEVRAEDYYGKQRFYYLDDLPVNMKPVALSNCLRAEVEWDRRETRSVYHYLKSKAPSDPANVIEHAYQRPRTKLFARDRMRAANADPSSLEYRAYVISNLTEFLADGRKVTYMLDRRGDLKHSF